MFSFVFNFKVPLTKTVTFEEIVRKVARYMRRLYQFPTGWQHLATDFHLHSAMESYGGLIPGKWAHRVLNIIGSFSRNVSVTI
jgi:hypothetical protein